MPKHEAVKALDIYKRAGTQAENLAHFYDFCRGLDIARTFQFPTLKQPPTSFLATMEEYIREAPQIGPMPNNRLEYRETKQKPEKPPEVSEKQGEEDKSSKAKQVEVKEEKLPVKEEEKPQLITTEEPVDLLGLNEVDPRVVELEDKNALALAIVPPGKENPSGNYQLSEIDKTSGWELALVTTPSNNRSQVTPDKELAGGFDKLLLDSLYEDNTARKKIQLQQAGYSTVGYGYEMPRQSSFNHVDPFAMSNHIAPPTNVQLMMAQQQQQMFQQQQQQQMMPQQNMMLQQQRPQHNMTMVTHYQYQGQYSQQTWYTTSSNPFGDPLGYPHSTVPPQGNHQLI